MAGGAPPGSHNPKHRGFISEEPPSHPCDTAKEPTGRGCSPGWQVLCVCVCVHTPPAREAFLGCSALIWEPPAPWGCHSWRGGVEEQPGVGAGTPVLRADGDSSSQPGRLCWNDLAACKTEIWASVQTVFFFPHRLETSFKNKGFNSFFYLFCLVSCYK